MIICDKIRIWFLYGVYVIMAYSNHHGLPKLETRLSAVVGPDLAHSLIVAASVRGKTGASIRTMLSQKLTDISDDQRKDVLQILDIYKDTLRHTRH